MMHHHRSTGTNLATTERTALADDLLRLGPQAPTILPGWDAIDLLIHLLQRERSPHHMALRAVPLASLRARVDAAEQQLRAAPWEQLVERFADGPPRLSPMRPLDPVANALEHLVHHEDLLRAQPAWTPRTLTTDQEEELMRRLRAAARLLVRTDVQVTLLSPLGSARGGGRGEHGSVQVSGTPLELALWVFGRDDVAQVDLDGTPAALEHLGGGSRGV